MSVDYYMTLIRNIHDVQCTTYTYSQLSMVKRRTSLKRPQESVRLIWFILLTMFNLVFI